MKTRRRLPCVGAVWALNAFVASLAGMADAQKAPWAEAAARAEARVETQGLPTLRELKKLPTFALSAVAEAAASRPFMTRRCAKIAAGLRTELERRRAKAATPDGRTA